MKTHITSCVNTLRHNQTEANTQKHSENAHIRVYQQSHRQTRNVPEQKQEVILRVVALQLI
jgi:hypothetical protein